MELRNLKYFLVIAEERNITMAANRLHISQPALSKQIKDLENEIGKKLIIRNNRGVDLTEEGELLERRAREILKLVEKTESELKFDQVRGDIYLGAAETVQIKYLTDTFKELQNKYPGIRLHIISGNNREIIGKLEKGLIDFGLIVEISESNLDRFESIEIKAGDKWGLLMRREDPLSRRSEIRSKDIIKRPLIVSEELFNTKRLEELLEIKAEDLEVVGTYNLLYNASIMVKSGLGIALGIENIISSNEDGDLKFIKLSGNKELKFKFIYQKEQTFSRAAREYLHLLKQKELEG